MGNREVRTTRQEGELYVHLDDLVRSMLALAESIGEDPEMGRYERQIASAAYERLALHLVGGNLSNWDV